MREGRTLKKKTSKSKKGVDPFLLDTLPLCWYKTPWSLLNR